MSDFKPTIRDAYVRAVSYLEKRGVREADSCVEILLCYLLGWNKSTMLLHWQDVFPEERWDEWTQLLERKSKGEPVQYITGEQEFYGIPFTVSSDVLIPRPETELLVEKIIQLGRELFPELAGNSVPVFADVGTGSGAIPVVIASHCPSWSVYGSDISSSALKVARANAVCNGVGDFISFIQGSLLDPYVDRKMAIDILVSNPPYIRSSDLSELQPEVRDHEPVLALDGGEDGLDFYREIVLQLSRLPAFPRLVGFEVGLGQASTVKELLLSCGGGYDVSIVHDLAGIERHVIGLHKN